VFGDVDGAGNVSVGQRQPMATFWSLCRAAYEISRTVQAIQGLRELRDFVVFPLHGELPPEQQDRAVSRYEARKSSFRPNVARPRSPSMACDGDRRRAGPGRTLRSASGH